MQKLSKFDAQRRNPVASALGTSTFRQRVKPSKRPVRQEPIKDHDIPIYASRLIHDAKDIADHFCSGCGGRVPSGYDDCPGCGAYFGP
jgi:hypothetical protein